MPKNVFKTQKWKFSFQVSKRFFFSICHSPLVVWPIVFFKFKKLKFSFQIWKMIFFQNFSFQFFLGGINKKILSTRLPNLLRNCKSYLFFLIKNNYILHTVHRKRGSELSFFSKRLTIIIYQPRAGLSTRHLQQTSTSL
jgi:hypothetical protein